MRLLGGRGASIPGPERGGGKIDFGGNGFIYFLYSHNLGLFVCEIVCPPRAAAHASGLIRGRARSFCLSPFRPEARRGVRRGACTSLGGARARSGGVYSGRPKLTRACSASNRRRTARSVQSFFALRAARLEARIQDFGGRRHSLEGSRSRRARRSRLRWVFATAAAPHHGSKHAPPPARYLALRSLARRTPGSSSPQRRATSMRTNAPALNGDIPGQVR